MNLDTLNGLIFQGDVTSVFKIGSTYYLPLKQLEKTEPFAFVLTKPFITHPNYNWPIEFVPRSTLSHDIVEQETNSIGQFGNIVGYHK